MNRRNLISRVPGAAQHERSEVMRCRPGTVTDSEYGTVPDQRCTTRAVHSRCTASGTRGIGRREFIMLLGGAAAARPLVARAQQPDTVRRIGVLMGLPEDDPETKARLAKFRGELKRLGWSEGRDLRIDTRFAPAGAQAQVLAKELVDLRPDVLLAHSAQIAAVLQRQTRAIPIVFVNVSDPIGAGFVDTLARPGANLTGLMHYEEGIVGKWLALLKEIAPRLARTALMADPKSPVFDYFVRSANAASPSLAIEVVPGPVENAADIERVFDAFARQSDGGLLLPPDITTLTHRDLIVALAARHRLPAVYSFRVFVTAGGLMSYGTDQVEMFGQTASYIDRILRGAKPADLPVQAPTKYETVLNLKTAKALGLTVPPGLLVAADEVIE
jgi:putative tryptophan/tyrosine transport system substrate-binding protein